MACVKIGLSRGICIRTADRGGYGRGCGGGWLPLPRQVCRAANWLMVHDDDGDDEAIINDQWSIDQ